MGYFDDWRFCPRCGGEFLVTLDHRTCAACGERYWPSSVPGAQAVIERDGRVLLGRRRNDPGVGRWDLPGGFLNEGEEAVAALHREVREETGLEVEIVEFLGTWNEAYWTRTVLCLTWVAHVSGGDERAGDDLVELRWFRPDERPRNGGLAFPTFETILALWESRLG